jgi:hypothetical protein
VVTAHSNPATTANPANTPCRARTHSPAASTHPLGIPAQSIGARNTPNGDAAAPPTCPRIHAKVQADTTTATTTCHRGPLTTHRHRRTNSRR